MPRLGGVFWVSSFGFDGRHPLQLPLAIPPQNRQIVQPAPQPIPHPVFGLPRPPWMVRDRDLFNTRSAAMSQYRHEPVEPIKGWNGGKDRSLENAEIAARVPKIHAQHQLPGC